MIKLCWEIDDVMHLKLNTMKKEDHGLSKKSLKNLEIFNWADYRLYNSFVKKQQQEIVEIGKEKVDFYKNHIIKRSEQLFSECIKSDNSQNVTKWMQETELWPQKKTNQTCYLATRDATSIAMIGQLVRWKSTNPEFFEFKDESKTNFPKFCSEKSAEDNFVDFLKNEEFNVRQFYNFSTNKFDLRETWPEYIKNFTSMNTDKEIEAWKKTLEEDLPYPHRIWN